MGEAWRTREDGQVGGFDLLARSGLPVPEGVVLKREAHRCFLESSGLAEDIESSARRGEATGRQASHLRRRYRGRRLEESLGRDIRGALLDLGARTVVVRSRERSEWGLGTIPKVVSAVRKAWLATDVLEHQLAAAAEGEAVPCRPVLIQREIHPEYTGWSTTGNFYCETASSIPDSVSAPPPRDTLALLTLEAGVLLGEGLRLKWGFESGRWYVLALEPDRLPGGRTI
ncbi:MAG: hypothetical protein WA990_06640 [Rubrobacteraceae bacterium]